MEIVSTFVRGLAERSAVDGPAWLRAAYAALPSPLPRPLRGVSFETVRADGVRCEWAYPPLTGMQPSGQAVVYCHGGGYVSGSVATHREIVARLAIGVGVPVLSIDYRLAPEHRYPAAHDDCLRAVRWLRGQGVPPSGTIITGDSAGGALALATMLALRDGGEPRLAAAALICPWVDPLAEAGSVVDNDRYDIIGGPLLRHWARLYASESQIQEPRLSLVTADLSGLPPLFLQWGGLEVLHHQIVALAERARAAGVTIETDIYPNMFHDFQVLASMVPEGVPAVARIIDFCRQALHEGGRNPTG